MPAIEATTIRESGSPQTFRLRDGRTAELRNGCLVVADTRDVLTGSHETAAYLLAHGRLSDEQREHWLENGQYLCDRMSSQESGGQCGSGLRRSNRIVERMEEAA